jgi:hypothetical protein
MMKAKKTSNGTAGKTKWKIPKGAKPTTKLLTIQLTDAELAERGMTAATKAGEVAELETEFEGVKEIWKAKIKKAEADRDVALEAIRRGTEDRNVDCYEVKNFETNKVEYWAKGKVLQSRDMTETDRQTDLPLKAKRAKTLTAPTTAMRKAEGAEPKELTAAQKDIASVHREETSKNGSWSVANGARG